MEGTMGKLTGKTLFITGASRGIGKEIALRAARDGANIVIAAKTAAPHPKLPGTIFTAAREVEQAGGKALPLQVDVRFEEQIAAAAAKAAETFGGIDILVNNAGAIQLTGTAQTPMKRFDLMHSVNVRATFAASQALLPYLVAAKNPHILTLSPPISLDPKWFRYHAGYTISKFGMSMCVLGMAEEFRDAGVAVNALWPRKLIATAALAMVQGVDVANCRSPRIVADAAHEILARDSRTCTGNFFLDEDVLAEAGMTDFSGYSMEPGAALLPDLFLA
jgi:citronellol/citronellal dehydrogenase